MVVKKQKGTTPTNWEYFGTTQIECIHKSAHPTEIVLFVLNANFNRS